VEEAKEEEEVVEAEEVLMVILRQETKTKTGISMEKETSKRQPMSVESEVICLIEATLVDEE